MDAATVASADERSSRADQGRPGAANGQVAGQALGSGNGKGQQSVSGQVQESGNGQGLRKIGPGRRKTFCWKKPDAPLAKVENLRRLEKAEISDPKIISPVTIAVCLVLGGALGLAGWASIAGDNHFRRDLEPFHWAGHPLIVYAQPLPSQITLEEEQNREVAYAKLRQDGLLDLPQLQPGKYRMYIDAPGYKTAFGVITLEDGRPTVVGYPEPLKLAPQ